MTLDALEALGKRQSVYPRSIKSCKKVYPYAKALSEIPNTLFCRDVPEEWTNEC
jgi:hypothetical protein